MRKIERPTKPGDFETRLAIVNANRRLREWVGIGKIPNEEFFKQSGNDPWNLHGAKKYDDYKELFFNAQHGRCAWCEMPVVQEAPADTDHYWPKAQVEHLSADATRTEYGLKYVKLQSGSIDCVLAVGFWWRAFEWENWCLSCKFCNSSWKGSLFPMQCDGENVPRPLLLNPFECEPSTHLKFSDDGRVDGLTDEGRETIRTLGLDRTSLNIVRAETAWRVHRAVDTICRTGAEADHDNAFLHLLDAINPARSETRFPGVARAIVQQRLLGVLAQLDDFNAKLASNAAGGI